MSCDSSFLILYIVVSFVSLNQGYAGCIAYGPVLSERVKGKKGERYPGAASGELFLIST